MQAYLILLTRVVLLRLLLLPVEVLLLLLPAVRVAVRVWLLPLPSSHPAQPSAA
jgi:hypothetical protein